MTQYIYCPCVICIVFCLSPAAPKKTPSISTKRLRVNSWPDSSCLEKAPGGTIIKAPFRLMKNSDVKSTGRRCPRALTLIGGHSFQDLVWLLKRVCVRLGPLGTWESMGLYSIMNMISIASPKWWIFNGNPKNMITMAKSESSLF